LDIVLALLDLAFGELAPQGWGGDGKLPVVDPESFEACSGLEGRYIAIEVKAVETFDGEGDRLVEELFDGGPRLGWSFQGFNPRELTPSAREEKALAFGGFCSAGAEHFQRSSASNRPAGPAG